MHRIEPILGAGYHTIHHTAYKYNYGHYTTIMDRWFGTLLTPDDYPAWLSQQSKLTVKASEPAKQVAVKATAL